MRNSGIHLATFGVATALLVGVTLMQGGFTERWAPASRDRIEQAATLLEAQFPKRFNDWAEEQELESDPKELDRAGAVGHISRLYLNGRSKARVSAFVVCALPHDASGHTPDRCYPGAGFTVGESEHRVTISIGEGRTVEAFTGTFVKAGQTLRIFWTYGVPGETAAEPLEWIAPTIARIALNGQPFVYKLYAIADQTRVGTSQSMLECETFISQLVPALDASLAAGLAPGELPPASPLVDEPAPTDAAAAN
jgi:hypothetical protein